MRLDQLLVERGLAETRARAQKLIAAGVVRGNWNGDWRVLDKPALRCPPEISLEVGTAAETRYVSRAGLKLETALTHLMESGLLPRPMAARDAIALDVGQSTGGFTECLLAAGAVRVVGLEVGHGQLAQGLRRDSRVVALEGVNARGPLPDLTPYAPHGFDFLVMDVSFISQTLIIPNVVGQLKPGGCWLSLIKPQFEVGPEAVGRGGVVRSAAAQQGACERVAAVAKGELDSTLVFPSQLPGADGNHEWFLFGRRPRG